MCEKLGEIKWRKSWEEIEEKLGEKVGFFESSSEKVGEIFLVFNHPKTSITIFDDA